MIDYEATMRSIGYDESLLETLIDIFLEDYPLLVSELEKAVRDQDSESVYGAAHRLKGLVSNFHDRITVELLAAIELAARTEKNSSNLVTVKQVNELCAATGEELKGYLKR
ncbi:MAG: Hpt domain-containing protein [Pirellulales bacterium]